MSIPFYFAMEENEAETRFGTCYAQLGFGFHEDGTLLLPAGRIPNAPAVINDRYLPAKAPDASLLDQLAEVCGNGCFLDFERPINEVSAAIAVGLRQRLRAKMTVPQALHGLCPDANVQIPANLCNCWEQFVRCMQTKFENNWVVEIIPWYAELPYAGKNVAKGYLQTAECRYRTEKGKAIYFDTRESIDRKLAIAEQYGCQAAITLLREYIQSAQFE